MSYALRRPHAQPDERRADQKLDCYRSIVGTRNDLADVFVLHAAGRTTVIAVDRKIEEVNQSINDVLAGTVPARVVFQF